MGVIFQLHKGWNWMPHNKFVTISDRQNRFIGALKFWLPEPQIKFCLRSIVFNAQMRSKTTTWKKRIYGKQRSIYYWLFWVQYDHGLYRCLCWGISAEESNNLGKICILTTVWQNKYLEYCGTVQRRGGTWTVWIQKSSLPVHIIKSSLT